MTTNSIINHLKNNNLFFVRKEGNKIQICLYNQAFPEDLFGMGSSKEELCVNAVIGALVRENFYINRRGGWGMNYDTPWIKKQDLVRAVKTLRRRSNWINKIEELSHFSMEPVYGF